jgi:hypothetical protein
MSARPCFHTLRSITLETADTLQKEILDQAVKAVGLLPNMYANMVNALQS